MGGVQPGDRVLQLKVGDETFEKEWAVDGAPREMKSWLPRGARVRHREEHAAVDASLHRNRQEQSPPIAAPNGHPSRERTIAPQRLGS